MVKKTFVCALLLSMHAFGNAELDIQKEEIEANIQANDVVAFVLQIQKTEDTPSWNRIAGILAQVVLGLKNNTISMQEIGDAIKDVMIIGVEDTKLVGSFQLAYVDSKKFSEDANTAEQVSN